MSRAAIDLPVTAAEYLEGELRSEIRREFVDGRIYAMPADSFRHNEICGDTACRFKDHLHGGPCRVFMGAVKVQIADDLGESYYYPDVFVTCEDADDKSHLARCPKLIIEVLSQSTSRFDRGEKLANYKRIPSVEEIVYIEQDWPEIYIVRRSDRWKKHIYTQFDSLIHLESIDLTLQVSAFYRSAPFPEDVRRPWYLINREDG
jgi:Uma2 family endonuclease